MGSALGLLQAPLGASRPFGSVALRGQATTKPIVASLDTLDDRIRSAAIPADAAQIPPSDESFFFGAKHR